MSEEQYEAFLNQMKLAVQESVKTTVNGKINALDLKLENYIKSDNEWKMTAQPAIDMGNNMRGFGLVFGYIASGFAGLYAIIKVVLLISGKK